MDLTWIPNSLSLGNLFFGFLSIIYSYRAVTQQDPEFYVSATFFILIATILDIFDGRAARKINRPNPIGKELDSLADLVTFGLAPGVMFYTMLFSEHPLYPSPIQDFKTLGAFISFLFPFFGAVRLAKFNIAESRNYFIGIPSPIAGGSCVLILTFDQIPNLININFNFSFHWIFPLIIFVFFAVLMNSKFVYPKSPPNFMNFSKKNSLLRNALSVVFLVCLVLFFKFFLMLYTLFYSLKPIFTYTTEKRHALS